MCQIKLFNTNFHYVFFKVKKKLYINCKIPSSYLQHIYKENYIYILNIWIFIIAAKIKLKNRLHTAI